MTLLKSLVDQGLTYDDLRDEVVNVCTNLVEADGIRGDILCPGLMDIQGPHVRAHVPAAPL